MSDFPIIYIFTMTQKTIANAGGKMRKNYFKIFFYLLGFSFVFFNIAPKTFAVECGAEINFDINPKSIRADQSAQISGW